MQELGFIIDKNGKISYFGEWVDANRKKKENKRSQDHTFSFEDDIESTSYFQSLHLSYEKTSEYWLRIAAFNFALQGLVVFFNGGSYYANESMLMYVPENITEKQKESLSNLYSTLHAFDTVIIKLASSNVMNTEDKFTSVDDYYDAFEINKENNLNLG